MDILEAASRGDLEQVRALVEQNAQTLHAQNRRGWTPLLAAASSGREGVVRYLLDAGADINHRAQFGFRALHVAGSEGHAGVVALLLRRGADITVASISGRTALLVAAFNGRDAVVRVMLEHSGSNMDAHDNGGVSAMHDACFRGHVGVLRQLLEAGADPTLRDDDGSTAVDHAVDNDQHDCVSILREWDRAYMLQRARRVRDAASTSVTNAPQQQHSS